MLKAFSSESGARHRCQLASLPYIILEVLTYRKKYICKGFERKKQAYHFQMIWLSIKIPNKLQVKFLN